ncbi:hypothetical protein LCGC14_3102220, partial [marine sediment metagenome]
SRSGFLSQKSRIIHFGLGNFKSFLRLQKINVKPLTVICGTNNCGKSSLIQSILLLSQSITSSFREFRRIPRYYRMREKIKYEKPLYFEGEFCHLSDYDNTINSFSINSEVVLSFTSGVEEGVNWVDIVTAETGTGPVIRSVGADTNVDLVFDTKGTGDIDVSTSKIVNVVDPTADQGAATKKYVDDNIGFDLGEFTVAGLPTASSNANGWALATDAGGGRTVVRSDGTDWKVVVVEGATVTT